MQSYSALKRLSLVLIVFLSFPSLSGTHALNLSTTQLRRQGFCAFMETAEMILRAAQQVQTPLSSRVAQEVERIRTRICDLACWDRTGCKEDCMDHQYACLFAVPKARSLDENLDFRAGHCKDPYMRQLQLVVPEWSIERVIDWSCPNLLEELTRLETWLKRLLKTECLDELSSPLRNTTLIEEQIERGKELSPNFESLDASGLFWTRHYRCAIEGLFGLSSEECYQKMIDSYMAKRERQNEIAHEFQRVCASL